MQPSNSKRRHLFVPIEFGDKMEKRENKIGRERNIDRENNRERYRGRVRGLKPLFIVHYMHRERDIILCLVF